MATIVSVHPLKAKILMDAIMSNTTPLTNKKSNHMKHSPAPWTHDEYFGGHYIDDANGHTIIHDV